MSNSSQLEGDFSALTSVLCKIPINLKILVVTDVSNSSQLEGDFSALTSVLCKIPINLKTIAICQKIIPPFCDTAIFCQSQRKMKLLCYNH